jgi:hypothetical protein
MEFIDMANALAKSRKQDNPYAVYEGSGFTWLVLKTYSLPHKEDVNMYARWFVAVKSPFTMNAHLGDFDSYELGDTYKHDVVKYGRLVAASPEWKEAYGVTKELPLPADYLKG